jgi:DNA-binding response OmpR family regulator
MIDSQKAKKILIVDDEKFVTDALEGFFHSKGYAIFKAEDGQACLDTVKKEALDLVLLDIKLPKVDGIQILKLLRQDYPRTKVIVMTAYDIEYKNLIDEIGCDAFFIKPLLIEELTRKVEELLKIERTVSISEKERVLPISQREKETPVSFPKNALPKARILIVSPRTLISGLIKDYFANREISQGEYETAQGGLEQSEQVKKFHPDIILFDIALIGTFGEFGLTLIKLPHPPREIILFGDPAIKWEETEALIERGTRFIELPSDLHDAAYPMKDTIQRLNEAVREACLKHSLFNKGGE